MKSAVILCLMLLTLPTLVPDLRKDKLIVFASLSYYSSDLDGDKRCDLSVWDPKTNTLYFQSTSKNQFYVKKFFDVGLTYTPVFADYDADGKVDFGFFQPDSGQWIIYLSSNPIPLKMFLGTIGDLPVPANIDNDKAFEPTVWRPNNNAWVLTETDKDGTKRRKVIFDGSYQDSVFAGDYDGDGKSDLLNWRPNDGYWHIVKSGTGFDFNQSEHIQHGQEWDIIVPNDYDADGRCDLVFWRRQDETWYFFFSGNQKRSQIKFGGKDDIPLSGDLNGDGIPELIMWNMSKKSWSVLDITRQETFSYKWQVPDGCLPAVSILQTYE